MPWPSKQIDSWEMFRELADKNAFTSTPMEVPHICRGQADSNWGLQSSLGRVVSGLTAEQALGIEERCIMEFRSTSKFFPEAALSDTNDFSDLTSWMRHFGAVLPVPSMSWFVEALLHEKRYGGFDLSSDPQLAKFRKDLKVANSSSSRRTDTLECSPNKACSRSVKIP